MTGALLPLFAFVAGLVSFSSPCCLPLIPGYLSYISALPVSDLGRPEARSVTFTASALFVAGFAVVFSALGLTATVLGATLIRNQTMVSRVLGVVVIALGLANVGVLRSRTLSRERRLDLARVPRGPAWAFPMGMAFAAGWVPCIGPILATILASAAVAGSPWWGLFLLLLYSAGLGLPFLALAVGYSRAQTSLDWLRRNGHTIERVGGVVLVVVGVLLVTGRWAPMFRPMQRWFAELGWPPI